MPRLRTSVMLLCLAVMLSAACRGNAEPDYGRTPVLFVHGHGLDSAYWDVLIDNLVADGYPRSYLLPLDMSPSRMSNRAAAERHIAPAVDALLANARKVAADAGRRDSQPHKIDIVSHSMGAVSSRWYVAKMSPEKVRTWISVAGANYGTNLLCGRDDDGAREMCPAFAASPAESEIQYILNGPPSGSLDPTPYGIGADGVGVATIPDDADRSVLYLTIRIEPDDWIDPPDSATIGGAGGISVDAPRRLGARETSAGNYLILAADDHDSLPRDATVVHLVTAMLRARD